MPSGPSDLDIGITVLDVTLLEQVEIDKKLETKIIKKTDGTFGQGQTFDPTIDFTVRGRGPTATIVGIATDPAFDGITGKTIITKVKHTQKNDDFDSFEFSGTIYPGALAP
jgi:hypothetical protein